jgi:hypothetical protein
MKLLSRLSFNCALALVVICLLPAVAVAYEAERYFKSDQELAAYVMARPKLTALRIRCSPDVTRLPPLPSSGELVWKNLAAFFSGRVYQNQDC